MTPSGWDPDQYLGYAEERGRPFADLLSRVGAVDPARVVDLGCGPGQLTATLAARWPGADVLGVDSSAAMVERALPRASARLRFEVGDLRQWRAERPVDVLVTNATLQWVPGHLDLLPRLVDMLAPGGWFALQVPANFDQPSHALLQELADDPRFRRYVDGVARPSAHDAGTYLDRLHDLGCDVDAWETTYLHVLAGEDPVFDWVSGTGARPVLQALPPAARRELEQEYRERLRAAYPVTEHGTVLPFRRVFAVARVASGVGRR